LEIIQNLARQRKEGAHGFTALHPHRNEQLGRGFHQSKNVPRGQGRRSMVQRLLSSANMNRRTAERSSDLPRYFHGHGVPFDSEYFSLHIRHADAAKRLEGMHATDGCSAFFRRREGPRVLRAAGVEHDFAAQLFSAHASKITRYTRNRIIRSGDQDYARREKASCQAAMRLPCSYEANRAPRGGLAAGNDNFDLPPQFAQATT
jgi:hypothetical protein